MAGRPPAFSYPAFKEVIEQFVGEGREPTYDDIRGRLGGRGSDGLIASYKTRLRGEKSALPDTAKIPEDLSNQIRAGLVALHATVRAEAESAIRVANEVQADELLQLGMRQDRADEEHQRELTLALAAAQKAMVQLEDRDAEIQRLRSEAASARDELRRLDVSLSLACSERDQARVALEKASTLMGKERSASDQSTLQLAVAQERMSAQVDQLQTLRAECSRLERFEHDAGEAASLKVLIQVHQEKADLMVQTYREHEQTIIALTAENKVLQRERDEFRGRAEEVQKMHLSSLNG